MPNTRVVAREGNAGQVSGGTSREVRLALLQAQTRRHFLRNLGGGLGTLFVGTSLVGLKAKFAAG